MCEVKGRCLAMYIKHLPFFYLGIEKFFLVCYNI